MYVQLMQQNGRVAQWLAYQTVDLVVAGSNPVSVAIKTDTATGTKLSSSGFLLTETGNQQEVTESKNGESGTKSTLPGTGQRIPEPQVRCRLLTNLLTNPLHEK